MGLLALMTKSAFAQTGCIGSISGKLYTTNTTGTNYDYTGTVIASAAIPTTVCITSVGANGTCTIVSVPFFGTLSGSLTTYSALSNCPLDDYVGYLFVSLSLLGYWFIRKQSYRDICS
ncbi:hypothetical protein [Pedobacter yonginense]|nr:hypothetical protein [Pedobacter yonginense]